MSRPQLILIILGITILSFAGGVFISVFSSNPAQANTDMVKAELKVLAQDAQDFYKRAPLDGGGGNSFTNWTISNKLKLTVNGTYSATVSAQSVTLVGKGNTIGNNGRDTVLVTMTVGPRAISSTIINSD